MNTAENSTTDQSPSHRPDSDTTAVDASPDDKANAVSVAADDTAASVADAGAGVTAPQSAAVTSDATVLPGAAASPEAAPSADAAGDPDAGEDELEADDVQPVQAEAAAAESAAPKPAPVADDVLLAAVDVARDALLKVTPASTIGEPAGHIVEDDHVLSLLFASSLPGYPGWNWTVTLARVDDGVPMVLETEMMPGDTALLAPEWVPWSERLADYRATQEAAELQSRALADAAAELEDEDEDEDEDGYSILHAGDVDGVDVDEIDDSADDDDDSDDDDSDDDDSDDDDSDDDDSDDDDSDDDDDDDSDDDDDDDDDDESDDDDEGDRTY